MANKSTKKLDQKYVLDQIKKSLPSELYDFTETLYTNARTKLIIKCKKHGDFLRLPRQAMNGVGCNICRKYLNSKTYLTIDEYKIYASEIYENKYDYSLVTDINNKIKIICPKHGIFTTRASAHIAKSQLYGCASCYKQSSKGENKIIKFLNKNNISFLQQWVLPGQVGLDRIQPLRYDFYLPDKNLIIEYHGPHHYAPTRYGGQTQAAAEFQFKRIQLYDQMKIANALLLRISVLIVDHKLYKILPDILHNDIIGLNFKNKIKVHSWETSDTNQPRHTATTLDYPPPLDNGVQ